MKAHRIAKLAVVSAVALALPAHATAVPAPRDVSHQKVHQLRCPVNNPAYLPARANEK
jgi:hypothetical protein